MAAAMTPPELERQLVVFSLHGERYGLPITVVAEIIRYTPPRVTAAARGLVRGMINLRGRILPIADLSPRLGRELDVGDHTRILVLELSHGALGLIVDSVEGVITVAESRIERLPVAAADNGLGEHVVAVDEHLVMLLDAVWALADALPQPAPTPRARPAAKRPARGSGA